MDNKFESGGGEQNTGIGDHAIGKQVNNFFCRLLGRIFTTGNQSPAIIAEKGHVTVTYNNSVIPPQRLEELAGQLAVTEAALASFFKILEEQQVPPGDLDSKLREIAANYKELLARVGDDQTAKQTIVTVFRVVHGLVARVGDDQTAKQAIEAGDYAKAEQLLEDVAKQQSIAAAEANADLAKLQEVQLRYAKAAAYWQKAAALLPEDKKKERALYLHEAGYDFHRVARYSEALSLYEQSLVIRREIGDKAGEGVTLNNISQIYSARGDSATALTYLEQSLMITQEIGNRAVEGTTLNNISQIYHARGDYTTALTYLEQSLVIRREIGDKEGEGTTLNNISQIYDARGDYTTALTYLEQSLVIHWEVGNRTMEGTTLSNIGALHHAKGDYTTALTYLEQSLAISREVGDKAVEGTTLNNIGLIHHAKGDSATALTYLEQSLSIRREIGDRRGEAETSWNIGIAYIKQGDLSKAEPYISRAVQLAEELGHPKLEEWRKALEDIRAKLRGK